METITVISIIFVSVMISATVDTIVSGIKIRGLKKMALTREKYIATLEERLRQERIWKNEQFNNKQK